MEVELHTHLNIVHNIFKTIWFHKMQTGLNIILNILNKPYQFYLCPHSHKWTKS